MIVVLNKLVLLKKYNKIKKSNNNNNKNQNKGEIIIH